VTSPLPPARLSEAAVVQNEALGAYAIWRFGIGFQELEGRAAPLHLAFLVLPLVLHTATLGMILSTQKSSGLHLLAGKLGEKREELLAVHERALSLRNLSLASLIAAEQAQLVRIFPNTAEVRSFSPHHGLRTPTVPERIRKIGPACEKIGHWFSSLSDQQVAHTLRVGF